METIFVDTSAWDAIEDSGDRYHAAALRFKEELVQQRVRLYVTNFILDECYTLLLRNIGYTRTVAFTHSSIQAGCRFDEYRGHSGHYPGE
jgi:predicted nucleic acid-binding protein